MNIMKSCFHYREWVCSADTKNYFVMKKIWRYIENTFKVFVSYLSHSIDTWQPLNFSPISFLKDRNSVFDFDSQENKEVNGTTKFSFHQNWFSIIRVEYIFVTPCYIIWLGKVCVGHKVLETYLFATEPPSYGRGWSGTDALAFDLISFPSWQGLAPVKYFHFGWPNCKYNKEELRIIVVKYYTENLMIKAITKAYC